MAFPGMLPTAAERLKTFMRRSVADWSERGSRRFFEGIDPRRSGVVRAGPCSPYAREDAGDGPSFVCVPGCRLSMARIGCLPWFMEFPVACSSARSRSGVGSRPVNELLGVTGGSGSIRKRARAVGTGGTASMASCRNSRIQCPATDIGREDERVAAADRTVRVREVVPRHAGEWRSPVAALPVLHADAVSGRRWAGPPGDRGMVDFGPGPVSVPGWDWRSCGRVRDASSGLFHSGPAGSHADVAGVMNRPSGSYVRPAWNCPLPAAGAGVVRPGRGG